MRITRRTLVAATLAAPAFAQAWPSRPIRFIVPYPPGGAADIIGRTVGNAIAPRLGQPVVVENRAGATGVIGMEAAARSSDGHTCVVAPDSAIFLPYLRPNLPYESLRDFSPVSIMVQQPVVVAAHPSLGARTLADLVGIAKARPGAINYVTSGTAGTHHLTASLFSQRAGIEMTHVPYRGGGQAINDLVAGTVPLGWLGSVRSCRTDARGGCSCSASLPRTAPPCCRTCRPSRSRAIPASTCRNGSACSPPPAWVSRWWRACMPR
jgi:tripartite-type tricarboxylate transporter receptor subunit TctC